jgi:hypothetical protein
LIRPPYDRWRGAYVGRLSPNADVQHARALASFREAISLGVDLRVCILAGPGCPVAEALAEDSWLPEDVPVVPLPGCVRSPCCGCVYSAKVKPDEPISDVDAAALSLEFDNWQSLLSPDEQLAIQTLLRNTTAAFGA